MDGVRTANPELVTVLNSDSGRLNSNASLEQIALHNDAYTQLWLQYIPNHDLKQREPQAYAKALLGTYPDKPNDAPVVYLQRWLAERITNNDSVTTGDPSELQRMMLVRGTNLGIPESNGKKGGGVLALRGKNGERPPRAANKCSKCTPSARAGGALATLDSA